MLKCPKCGSTKRFYTVGYVDIIVDSDGERTNGRPGNVAEDIQFLQDPSAPMSCCACNHDGKQEDFE